MTKTSSAPAEVSAKKEVSTKTVTMTDGRVVEFSGKKRLDKESFVSEDGKTISCRLDFVNGETRLFQFSSDHQLFTKFAAHGAEQKLGDEIAGVADIEDAVQAVDELIARLDRGEWGQRREGGSGASGASILAKALVEHTGKTPAQIKDFLSKKTPKEKLALRANEKIKPIIDRLEAEKAKKSSGDSIDTDALLGELED